MGFWPATLANPTTPIHIVEGAEKAAALLSRGLAAISISGCWNGQKAGKLNKLIRKFAAKGRPAYLWPDQDWHDKGLVRKGWATLG
ncbi:MAG: DUF3854 domain-containing protein [Gloeomargaritaceae cyanobacterium C42_A2020_066]|nr:DUF3854 domain-containing protein [Gloeomargaritaceae cyanobacterium C42_A2020_066]